MHVRGFAEPSSGAISVEGIQCRNDSDILDACCYSLSLIAWYLLTFLFTSYSSSLWHMFLLLGSLLDTFKFTQLILYRTLTPRCSHSTTTGWENTSLLICDYAYQWTALPSVRFSRIGHIFLLTHLVLSYSMEFHAYAFLSISSQLPVQ